MLNFMRLSGFWIAFFAPLSAQDDALDMVTVPLEGLVGRCCERLVSEALLKSEEVAQVTFDNADGLSNAHIRLKRGHGLPLSSVEKAMTEANTHLKSHTGTRYGIAPTLSITEVHLFRTRIRPEGANLKESLGKLMGFKAVRIYEGGFSPSFTGNNLPSIDAVKEAVKKGTRGAVTDLVLGASHGGVRHACPMHPEKVSALPAKCPLCGMKMETIEASVLSVNESPSDK